MHGSQVAQTAKTAVRAKSSSLTTTEKTRTAKSADRATRSKEFGRAMSTTGGDTGARARGRARRPLGFRLTGPRSLMYQFCSREDILGRSRNRARSEEKSTKTAAGILGLHARADRAPEERSNSGFGAKCIMRSLNSERRVQLSSRRRKAAATSKWATAT